MALIVSIAVGVLILAPSLSLLYGLLLGGRFEAAPTQEEHPRRRVAGEPRPIAALVLLAVGVALTLLGKGVLLAIGVLALIAFVAVGTLELLRPRMFED